MTEPTPPIATTPEAAAAINKFMSLRRVAHREERARQRFMESLAQEKALMLVPVRQMLLRLIDLGLMVPSHDPRTPDAVVRFQVFEDESSPSWRPGTSLRFMDPVPVEIAVVNPGDRAVHGIFVVAAGDVHPDLGGLQRRFDDAGDLCNALATFLARNTVRVERWPEDRDA